MNGMNYTKISKILSIIYIYTNIFIFLFAFFIGDLVVTKYFFGEKIPKLLFHMAASMTPYASSNFFIIFLEIYFFVGFLSTIFLKIQIKYKLILLLSYILLYRFMCYSDLIIRQCLFPT